MNMADKGLYAEISAQVSMVVFAGGKREAEIKARVQLTEESIRLMKVKMVNGEGNPCWFRVEAVHAMEWKEAVWSGYTGKYMVTGTVRLTVNSGEPGAAASHRPAAYALPRSVVNGYPHWTVPSAGGSVFLCVQSYELEWRSEVGAAVLSKVG